MPALRVIVTRPRGQMRAWVERLQGRGIDAVALPLLEIGAAPDPGAVAAAWSHLHEQALVVFVSANAVDAFHAARPESASWPSGVRAAAPGPGTADALRSHGIDVAAIVSPDADASQHDSEALWQRLGDEDWRARRVLVVRGEAGRDWLGEQLHGAGAIVETLAAYRRLPPDWSAIERATLQQTIDHPDQALWLFTNSEAIDRLGDAVPGTDWSRHQAVASHPRIASRARSLGFGRVVECAAGIDKAIGCIQSIRP